MDGSDRLFVAEQQGVVRIIQDGEALPVPFLDLRDRVSTSGGVSRGLLGLVFHPHYADNGYFFVHYTNSSGNSVIARYKVSDDPNITNYQSELGLLEIEYPIGEHIGGDLAFGPDGYLYISIGDGGGPGDGDQEGNAQKSDSLLGKRVVIQATSVYHVFWTG
ncbi:MAG: PQQ-dependent sugar dehydrogenase, partial [Chloroflexota bacterium]|nr:PQQ-dependent sugar dehydrogenase [Chloroflexota bacterium]